MNLATAAQSSIGRKLINGLTGLLLVGFVIGHLIGNLLLLVGPDAFNNYAYFLENVGHGKGVLIAEFGLIVIFLSHAWSGYSVWRKKWEARKSAYAAPGDAGGASKKSMSSTSMLWTGILLLGFTIWHVMQFKFGIIDRVDRSVTVDGVHMKDLYGLVIDTFGQPVWTGVYLIVMAALGMHLWHGAWSAFQSLGLANDKYLPTITKVAHLVAAVLAAGFLALPFYICVSNGTFAKADKQYVMKYQTPDNSSESGAH
jgi:succinate dehydrogenase / fumarate reductase cytochrome b subunit